MCDVLNVEWSSKGRDIDIVEPVLYWLEKKYKLKVARCCISDYFIEIIRYRPKAILLSNGGGGEINVEVVKLAAMLGISVITLVSEGDYVNEGKCEIESFFWGLNKERKLYSNLNLQWSTRCLNLIHTNIENSAKWNIQVSGATGFDRYKFLRFLDKKTFLKKYAKEQYSKIVGIAAWGFDLLLSDKYNYVHTGEYAELFSATMLNFHRKSLGKIKEIYDKIITENPDVLFILKHHPGMIEEALTEFSDLQQYENVLIIKKFDENISDVINVSDLWIGYETTTCLEAWLLGKKTLLINPLCWELPRSMIANGSPIYKKYEEVQGVFNSFFEKNKFVEFDEKDIERKKIIKDIIEWDDGKNHIRAGELIYQEICRNRRMKRKLNCWVVKVMCKNLLRFYLNKLPVIRLLFKSIVIQYYSDAKIRFSKQERQKETRKYKEALDVFYDEQNIK